MCEIKVCKRCGEEKPLNFGYFHKNCDAKDGFLSRCKICCSKYRKSRSKNKNHYAVDRGNKRRCTKCGKWKVLNSDNFKKSRYSVKGFITYCKDCYNRIEREKIRFDTPDCGGIRQCVYCGNKKELNGDNFDLEIEGKFSRICKVCKQKREIRNILDRDGKRFCYCCKTWLSLNTKNFNVSHTGNSSTKCNKCIQNACRDQHRKTQRQYRKRRMKEDICYKLRIRTSISINKGLKRNNSNKNGVSCFKKLRYTVEELKSHLEFQFEPWMNWNNHGVYNPDMWDDNDPTTWVWQLDHIIPHSELPYKSMDDPNFYKCWSLENLRPYSAKMNIIDGANKSRHK